MIEREEIKPDLRARLTAALAHSRVAKEPPRREPLEGTEANARAADVPEAQPVAANAAAAPMEAASAPAAPRVEHETMEAQLRAIGEQAAPSYFQLFTDAQEYLAAHVGGQPSDYPRDAPRTIEAARAAGVERQVTQAIELSRALAPTVAASSANAARVEKRRAREESAPVVSFERSEPPPNEFPPEAKADRPSAPAAPMIAPLDWRDLAARGTPPAREWIVPGWIGAGHVTLLAGPGGIGKSLLIQQVCSALAVNAACIEEPSGYRTSLAWMCEDDADELHRRSLPIAHWLGAASIEAFADRFYQVPREGEDNVLGTTEFGRLMFTPGLEELRQQAHDLKAQLVVLDNVRQIFGGNENDNPSVTQFLNRLVGALRGMAVLLLAHPAKAHGSEFAGGAAWENAARTRLYFGERLPDEPQDQEAPANSTGRVLARRKANYAAKDLRRFQYESGVLVPEAIEEAGVFMDHLRAARIERVLLAAARKLAEMGAHFTDGASSPAFLPRVVLEYKLGEGATKRELADAMRNAMLAGKLKREVVGQYPNRTPRHGLKVIP